MARQLESNTYLTMIGRADGSDIVQLGRHPNGELMRWSFRNITDKSFDWVGEHSPADRSSWTTHLTYRAVRARPRQ